MSHCISLSAALRFLLLAEKLLQSWRILRIHVCWQSAIFWNKSNEQLQKLSVMAQRKHSIVSSLCIINYMLMCLSEKVPFSCTCICIKFISVKMKLSMAYVLITWSFEGLYFQSFYFQYDCEILQSKPSVF